MQTEAEKKEKIQTQNDVDKQKCVQVKTEKDSIQLG